MSEQVQRCPVCGKSTREVKHWVQCPAYKAPICDDHHMGCKYLDNTISRPLCKWNDKAQQERERRREEWQNAHYEACRSAKWDGRPMPTIYDTARLFGGWIPEDLLQAAREREAREAAKAARQQPAQQETPPPPPEKKKTPGEEQKAAAFAEFWEAYPKKDHKQEAETAAKRISLIMWPIILADVRARKKTVQWADKKYIPNPATYLRHKRWEDQLGPQAEEQKPARSRAALMSEDAGSDVAGYNEAVNAWRPKYSRQKKSP